jgi:hypothetical protein
MDSQIGQHQVPLVLYEKNGQPVFVPAHVADLFRDLPPENNDSLSYDDDEPFDEHDEARYSSDEEG